MSIPRLALVVVLEKRSDKELLLDYQVHRDHQIIGLLFKRYSHLVTGLALNYLKDKELSKDAVMDIFEFLLKNIQNYEVSNFKSWLLTLTRNHCLKLITRSIKRENNLFDKNKDVYSVEYEDVVDHNNEEMLNSLEEGLDQLKPHHQKCLTLFYLKGKSYEEVAAITSYDLKQVKSYIQNGKKNLKKRLTL